MIRRKGGRTFWFALLLEEELYFGFLTLKEIMQLEQMRNS